MQVMKGVPTEAVLNVKDAINFRVYVDGHMHLLLLAAKVNRIFCGQLPPPPPLSQYLLRRC